MNKKNLVKKDKSFIVNVVEEKPGNSKPNDIRTGDFSAYAVIDPGYEDSSYIYSEFLWWGSRVFFSSKAIKDIGSYLGWGEVGSPVAEAAGIGEWLAKKAFSLQRDS
jgi:hypothetical protein